MTIDNRRRLELYEAVRTSLGEPAAGTLMELLPVDPSELATKQDLAVATAELRSEIAGLRADMHDLFRKQTSQLLTFLIPTLLSGIGLAFVAARFGG